MLENQKLCYSKIAKFLFNGDKTIVFNRISGEWIKIPTECYEIICNCAKENFTAKDMLEAFEDDNDRKYMEQLLSLLESINCLYFDKEQVIDNISFSITHRCNLKCIHCMIDAKHESDVDFFNTKEICSSLDKIIASNPRLIVITGGEPMIRSDFIQILTYLHSNYNGKLSLMTNGTLFTDTNVKLITEFVDSIDISLDGADETSCSVVRGKGVFKKVMDGIKLLQKYGFKNINLSMILSNNNTRYVKQFFELNKKINTRPILRALSYEGRALKNKEKLDNILTSDNEIQNNNSTMEPRCCACTAGFNQFTIEANGDIYPGNLFVSPEFKLGNIKDIKSIKELLPTDDNYFVSRCIQPFEPSNFSKCKNCNINYFCWSCLFPMSKFSNAELEERCAYKKQLLSHIWD